MRLLLVLALIALASPAPAAPPNIIFILADDLGYGDLGCYGQKQILTPHLDQLAAEGMRFTQFYAGAPVCAPSRCALMTGRHNGHGRVRDNIPHGVFLEDEDVTLAEVLRSAGYRTGGIGKWGLGDHGSAGTPWQQGFDSFYGYLNQDHAHIYYPDFLWENDRVVLLPGNRGERKQQYTPDLFAEKAVRFIEENKARPFFLYLACTLPHWSDYPLKSAQSLIVPDDAPYTDRDWPQVAKNYAAMITRLDRNVGRLLEKLREFEIEKRTLVIFTSDNGPSAEAAYRPDFFQSGGVLRGVKRDLYEGAIRVPMLVKWPGQVPAGQVSDAVWSFWDVFPTLAEIAGQAVAHKIDGRSALAALKGGKAPRHDYLYWDYGHARGEYRQAVRLNDWKAVRNGQDRPIELYDLKRDIGETRDVAAEHPEIVARMEQIMATAATPDPHYPIAAPKPPRSKAR